MSEPAVPPLRTWRPMAAWGLVAGGVLLLAVVVYSIGFYRPRYESERPLSLTEAAAHLDFELPVEAEQIWIFKQCVGPGHYREMMKFRAPLGAALAWAGQMGRTQAGWKARDVSSGKDFADDLAPGFPVPAWWDIHSIQDGVLYANEGSPGVMLWIDKRREMVYYWEAD